MDPISDFLPYLTKASWTTAVFWGLLLGGTASAALSWRSSRAGGAGTTAGLWAVRMLLGIMWWQGSIWKVPPGFDGLVYWMNQIVEHALIPLHAQLVRDVVLPNIALFGRLVYAAEVFVAVTLLLGLLTRLGALVGLGVTANLLLGLYAAPGEWPWTYGFLILLQVVFLVGPTLPGVDAALSARRAGRV